MEKNKLQVFEESLSEAVIKIHREAMLRQKKALIEKACQWITEHIDIPYEGEFINDSPVASDYIEWCEKRLEYAKAVADAFKQAMEEQYENNYLRNSLCNCNTILVVCNAD